MATADRLPIVEDQIFAGAIAALLIEVLPAQGIDLGLYCVMPDHLHVVAHVTTGNLLTAVQAFKSHGARLWLDWGGSGPLWQRSFHDHGLRTPADYDAAV